MRLCGVSGRTRADADAAIAPCVIAKGIGI